MQISERKRNIVNKTIQIDLSKDNAKRSLKEGRYDIGNCIDRIPFNIEYDDSDNFYLGDYFDFFPYGIIDKKTTGIGATTLEMNAKRNSIIVTPTKILAYLKKEKNSEEFFYLGSNISGQNTNSNTSELKLYLKKDSIEFKKIFVVADILPKLMIVFEELKIDYANEYFIMYDEINKFIEDSSYRENLMNAFDYYAKFNPKNRAMVTATFDEYSH